MENNYFPILKISANYQFKYLARKCIAVIT